MLYMATRNGLEPSTSSVTGWRANRLHHRAIFGGNNRARTCDPMLVRHVLSQLSYAPKHPPICLYISATGIIIPKEALFVKHFFRFFMLKFQQSKPCIFTTIYYRKLCSFYDLLNILGGKTINLITELTLHRKRLSFLCNFCKFFFAQAD